MTDLRCEYCDRQIPDDVDQSDLPYPEHVACSHECSIFRAHQRDEVDV